MHFHHGYSYFVILPLLQPDQCAFYATQSKLNHPICLCVQFVLGYGASVCLCWSSINIAGSCYLYRLSFPPLSTFNNLSFTRSELCAQATLSVYLYACM